MVKTEKISAIWEQWKPSLGGWQHNLLPGMTVLVLVIGARLLGLFQSLEWKTLDTFMRLRPAEVVDERVLIVAIDDDYLQRTRTYPVSDEDLVRLLKTLAPYQPRAVGIDIYRDLPVDPGHLELVQTLAAQPDVFGIEKLFSPAVPPPPTLPPERVGFADFLNDSDGFIRRSLLGAPDGAGNYHFSLALRLAEHYLKDEGIELDNGVQDPVAMRLGEVELTRFRPNSGGYIHADAGGNQVLLNVRSGSQPFRIVPIEAVLAGQVDPAWIRDRIVIIGITSLSTKDVVNSAAVVSDDP